MNEENQFINKIRFNELGLVPVIIQDIKSGKVLMMAWMDRFGLIKTIETGETWFYSRSRQTSWHKGGTSGHVQKVVSINLDCDGDTLLIEVYQLGGACHNGYYSCFYRELNSNQEWTTEEKPVFAPESIYKLTKQDNKNG